MTRAARGVFAGYGIELEYMIVDGESLAVLPLAEPLLEQLEAGGESEGVEGFAWSNEIVAHVVEVKNFPPQPQLETLTRGFNVEVARANRLLAAMGARLMPTAMHPRMDPRRETQLWPHDPETIYRTYDRIFDCDSHGWSNVQSMHLNFPFAGDREFERLHAAIRLIVPIVPALAASSPITDGVIAACADTRLDVCATSAARMPSIAGLMVPESVSSRAEYEELILAPMYREIAPHDADGVLQHEWLNSRAAIARFDRSAIELRAFDVQECPRADLAIAQAVVGAVKELYESGRDELRAQQALATERLAETLDSCIAHAEKATIVDREYLQQFSFPGARCEARELWAHLIARCPACRAEPWQQPLEVMLEEGPLARRILRVVGDSPGSAEIDAAYAALCACLAEDRMFRDLR
jgi:carboxylate-amine ligase